MIDRFHIALANTLTPKIDDKMTALASGSAFKTESDTRTTAEKYAAEVAYIQALNDVLAMCHELENDMYGARPGTEDQQQE